MDQSAEMQVVIVSGACCMAHLARLDKTVEANLQQAIAELGTPVSVRKVSLSAVLDGAGDLSDAQRKQVLALFGRHSAAFTPAVFINDQARFAGAPPTVQQIKDALSVAAMRQP